MQQGDDEDSLVTQLWGAKRYLFMQQGALQECLDVLAEDWYSAETKANVTAAIPDLQANIDELQHQIDNYTQRLTKLRANQPTKA